jgi:pyruvate kinase
MEIDGEIQAKKSLYFPALNPKKDFDMDLIPPEDVININ